jgi:hypothetical protein
MTAAPCQYERFPEADEVIAEEFLLSFRVKANKSSILSLSPGHAYDQEVLEWAVGTEAYIGMIGPGNQDCL